MRGDLSDRQALIISRLGTVIIAGIATYAARFAPSIIEGLLTCYSIWAPGLLVPLLLGLYLKRTRAVAGWLSMICGSASSILWQTVLKEPAGIPAIFAGLIVSVVAYGIGMLIGHSRSNDRHAVEEVAR